MRTLIVGGLILLVLLLVPGTQAASCSALTSSGWQPDTDCDTVPDYYDNCVVEPNSDQTDRNRNGFGDKCDLMIEYISVSPDSHLKQGQFSKLSINIINNRDGPVDDVLVSVKSNSLDIHEQTTLESVPLGEQARVDFWLKVPKCTDTGAHELTITTGFDEPYTHTRTTEVQEQSIYIESGNVCGTEDGALDNSIIEVFHEIVVDRTDAAILPIRISNFGPDQATYHLSADDLGMWGTWRLDPAPSVQLPSGKHATLYLLLETNEYTQAGTRTVFLTITTDDQETSIPIDVYVRAPVDRARAAGTFALELIIILVAIIFAAILIFVALRHVLHRHPRQRKTTTKSKKTTRKRSRKKVAVQNVKRSKRKTHY